MICQLGKLPQNQMVDKFVEIMSAKAIAEEFSHDKKQECAKGREEDRKQHADDCHHNCMRDDAMQIMMMTGMMPCK